jgi:hypothetical protein
VFWTVCKTGLEVIGGYVELPGHDAVMEWVPTARLLVLEVAVVHVIVLAPI